eukprot:5643620-Pleurochrysis_carterae.AAC.1
MVGMTAGSALSSFLTFSRSNHRPRPGTFCGLGAEPKLSTPIAMARCGWKSIATGRARQAARAACRSCVLATLQSHAVCTAARGAFCTFRGSETASGEARVG